MVVSIGSVVSTSQTMVSLSTEDGPEGCTDMGRGICSHDKTTVSQGKTMSTLLYDCATVTPWLGQSSVKVLKEAI